MARGQIKEFLPYAFTVAKRLVGESLQTQAALTTATDQSAVDEATDPSCGNPDSSIDAKHALAELPERARAVCVLHYCHGLKTAEIAAATGRSVAKIRRDITVGRAKLIARLGPDYHDKEGK